MHAGQDDEKLQKAIATGSKVDVGLSYSTDIVGNFCSNGAFRNLNNVIKRDGVDMSQFSPTVKSYTEFKGMRCAMPMLADVYGLYYNKDLLSAAGFTAPPKTLSELETMADKLTTYNADGSHQDPRLQPDHGLVRERGRALRSRSRRRVAEARRHQRDQLQPRLDRADELAEGVRRQDRLGQAEQVHLGPRPGVLGRQRLPERARSR